MRKAGRWEVGAVSKEAGHAYSREHQLKGDALLFDLSEQATSILAEAGLGSAARAARTLIKDGPLRLTIVGLKAGGSLRDHKAGGPVSIQLLQGEVEVMVGGRSQRLTEKQALVLGADIVHSVSAHADSVILLSIAMLP